MITKVIGVGAAGNKAAIGAVEDEVIKLVDVLLVNSTLKDIPKDYEGAQYCFDAYGGCGKERSIANDLCMKALESGEMGLEKFLKVGEADQAELVVLVSSTEGGTGSGTVPVLASYINDVLGINVHCFAFAGFEDDARGLKNTVEYFKEMGEEFGIECLQNSKFMDEYDGDKLKAEKAANHSFSQRLSILMGNPLRDSDHNIDQTDLLKVATTPGYMIIEYKEFKKIKNKAEFKAMVKEMLDVSAALDLNEPSQKRLAVIINIDEDNTGIIDYQDTLVNRLGTAYEKFEHIQHEKSMPEFIAFISAGSRVPVDEIQEIYDKYQEQTGKIKKNKDDFFAKSQELEFDAQDDMFDINGKQKAKMDKSAFFKKNKFANTVVKVESRKSVDDDY